MRFIKKNSIFFAIAIMSCILDIWSKFAIFEHFKAVILPPGRPADQEYLFDADLKYKEALNKETLPEDFQRRFIANDLPLSGSATVKPDHGKGEVWWIYDTQYLYLVVPSNRNSLLVYCSAKEYAGADIVVPAYYEPIPVIPHLFNLRVAFNRGAVWGSFQGRVGMLTIFSVAAIAFILYLVAKNNYSIPYQISLSLILGGAAGNLWDRLWFAGVRDFLDFYIGRNHWPTFNLADVYIVVGIAGYLLIEWRQGKSAKTSTKNS